jgi:radical SAM superfamily enzyme YgiQ (UPF0313 family)
MGSHRFTHNPLFRPPAEADSLILQVEQGCPYNRCTFCGMYQSVPYRRLGLPDVRGLIASEARRARTARRVFLADGDVMRRSFDELQAILQELATQLPALARVNLYATGSAIAAKTDTELKALRALKLHTLYLGLESGDEAVLRNVSKGESARQMVEAGQRAQAAGLRMSVMVLLGLGGQDHSRAHVTATAQALNQMQPRLLSALRVVPVPGTGFHDEVQAGRFRQVSEAGIVRELRDLLNQLALEQTVFRANHASNVVPIEARLPHDTEALLGDLNDLLASGALDETSPGAMPLWL